MTRTYTDRPIWSWRCDRCGHEDGDIGRTQLDLPTPDEMRERGWYIAPIHGDLCTQCVVETKETQ